MPSQEPIFVSHLLDVRCSAVETTLESMPVSSRWRRVSTWELFEEVND